MSASVRQRSRTTSVLTMRQVFDLADAIERRRRLWRCGDRGIGPGAQLPGTVFKTAQHGPYPSLPVRLTQRDQPGSRGTPRAPHECSPRVPLGGGRDDGYRAVRWSTIGAVTVVALVAASSSTAAPRPRPCPLQPASPATARWVTSGCRTPRARQPGCSGHPEPFAPPTARLRSSGSPPRQARCGRWSGTRSTGTPAQGPSSQSRLIGQVADAWHRLPRLADLPADPLGQVGVGVAEVPVRGEQLVP
jgi:hypothetical protein